MDTELTLAEQDRKTLDCKFPRVLSVLDACMTHARAKLTPAGVAAYLEGARVINKTGRGEDPVLAFLEEMPLVAAQLGEDVITDVVDFSRMLARSPNSRAMAPFLQSLLAAARALESIELFREYLVLVQQTMQRTTPKVHGIDSMYASDCLLEFLTSVPSLFGKLSLVGLRHWVDYGVKGYANDPDNQREYFSLKTADSRAVVQRERHGALLVDNERKLDLYLRGLWASMAHFVPYSLDYDDLRKPMPYLDNLGIHLPDVYDALPNGVSGVDRYRALLAHVIAHKRWTSPLIADNFSPFQRMSIEMFEDSRVEYLAMQAYPGLRELWGALHPIPKEGACPEGWSSLRHRLYMLSRALLDPQHGYTHPVILKYVQRFHETMQAGNTSTESMVPLALHFIVETRAPSDFSSKVWFEDTEVDYRDDNRQMWRFIEEGDEEVYENRPTKPQQVDERENESMPPRLYPEWDYGSGQYRPDWVSVYEYIHPKGDPNYIDKLLAKHSMLAKRLKKMIDLLKPQQKVRIRYQEEGSELDLDIALRSLIELKSGAQPDPRINMSHRHDGRSVAVSLLLDLSASLGDVPDGAAQTKLELGQEAVSLLAWAIEKMGDPFAIGGFNSDTRHAVRYQHFKGYKEHWGTDVKARLAAMEPQYSTRMGAAMRHAGHYLAHQQAEKKLLLVLTDGEPADIDVHDPRLLIEDARLAVRELDQQGIYTFCINLDPKADEYVADIFGKQYAVIDNIARLPERMPQLFMSLVK